VLVLDEVETLQRLNAQTREKSLNALRQLVDALAADMTVFDHRPGSQQESANVAETTISTAWHAKPTSVVRGAAISTPVLPTKRLTHTDSHNDNDPCQY
jgi:hypothetical protein